MSRSCPNIEGHKNFGFSRYDYQDLLRALVGKGYKDVTKLDDIIPLKQCMFLRHDVDMCLDRAQSIASAEAEIGIRATYYVLVSTPIYNIASAASREVLKTILSHGHEIGLHFDASQYDQSDRIALEEYAQRECAILEMLCDTEIASISFHRPAPSILGHAGKFAGRPHSYQPRFTKEIGYISDSSGGFYQGHPLDHPAVLEGRSIQLLTHPVWWHEEEPTTAAEAIERLRLEQYAKIGAVLDAATAKAKARKAETDL